MTDIRFDNCCGRCRCAPVLTPQPPCQKPPEDRDIQIDFYPEPCKTPVIWGTVYDECKRPLSGGLVELLQCKDENNSCCLVVGQTYSDCNGHYEIPIPSTCQGRYRIEVSNPGACRVPILSANYKEGDLPRRRQNNICYY